MISTAPEGCESQPLVSTACSRPLSWLVLCARRDRKEFIRAVRVDARVPDTKITDREVDELFKCVDTGDGLISGEEFRLFLAAKKDMKKKAMSGALGRKKGDSVEGDGATSPSAKVGSPRQTDAEMAAER